MMTMNNIINKRTSNHQQQQQQEEVKELAVQILQILQDIKRMIATSR
jgi:hypothetical protein